MLNHRDEGDFVIKFVTTVWPEIIYYRLYTQFHICELYILHEIQIIILISIAEWEINLTKYVTCHHQHHRRYGRVGIEHNNTTNN